MKRFTLLLSMFVFLFSLTGCPWKDDDVDVDINKTCITTDGPCSSAGTYESCANTKGDAWYEWRGKKYPCNSGGDCVAAAQKLVDEMSAYCN